MSAGVVFKISCSLNVILKRSLQRQFNYHNLLLCAVDLRRVGRRTEGRECARLRPVGATDWCAKQLNTM